MTEASDRKPGMSSPRADQWRREREGSVKADQTFLNRYKVLDFIGSPGEAAVDRLWPLNCYTVHLRLPHQREMNILERAVWRMFCLQGSQTHPGSTWRQETLDKTANSLCLERDLTEFIIRRLEEREGFDQSEALGQTSQSTDPEKCSLLTVMMFADAARENPVIIPFVLPADAFDEGERTIVTRNDQSARIALDNEQKRMVTWQIIPPALPQSPAGTSRIGVSDLLEGFRKFARKYDRSFPLGQMGVSKDAFDHLSGSHVECDFTPIPVMVHLRVRLESSSTTLRVSDFCEKNELDDLGRDLECQKELQGIRKKILRSFQEAGSSQARSDGQKRPLQERKPAYVRLYEKGAEHLAEISGSRSPAPGATSDGSTASGGTAPAAGGTPVVVALAAGTAPAGRALSGMNNAGSAALGEKSSAAAALENEQLQEQIVSQSRAVPAFIRCMYQSLEEVLLELCRRHRSRGSLKYLTGEEEELRAALRRLGITLPNEEVKFMICSRYRLHTIEQEHDMQALLHMAVLDSAGSPEHTLPAALRQDLVTNIRLLKRWRDHSSHDVGNADLTGAEAGKIFRIVGEYLMILAPQCRPWIEGARKEKATEQDQRRSRKEALRLEAVIYLEQEMGYELLSSLDPAMKEELIQAIILSRRLEEIAAAEQHPGENEDLDRLMSDYILSACKILESMLYSCPVTCPRAAASAVMSERTRMIAEGRIAPRGAMATCRPEGVVKILRGGRSSLQCAAQALIISCLERKDPALLDFLEDCAAWGYRTVIPSMRGQEQPDQDTASQKGGGMRIFADLIDLFADLRGHGGFGRCRLNQKDFPVLNQNFIFLCKTLWRAFR